MSWLSYIVKVFTTNLLSGTIATLDTEYEQTICRYEDLLEHCVTPQYTTMSETLFMYLSTSVITLSSFLDK